MTVAQCLRQATELFTAGGIDSAYLDALLLFAHSQGLSKSQALARLPETINLAAEKTFGDLVTRRLSGEPIAYLTGLKEFFGLDFVVGPGVLIPRPETEILVEWVLESFTNQANFNIRDLCTGTACIPISLWQERPNWQIEASDISPAALVWANQNNQTLSHGQIKIWEEAGLISWPTAGYQVITANPPYVPRQRARQLAATWGEPVLALDGGDDGLDLVKTIIQQSWTGLAKGGSLFLEIGDQQANQTRKLLVDQGFSDCQIRADLAGIGRIVRGSKA